MKKYVYQDKSYGLEKFWIDHKIMITYINSQGNGWFGIPNWLFLTVENVEMRLIIKQNKIPDFILEFVALNFYQNKEIL